MRSAMLALVLVSSAYGQSAIQSGGAAVSNPNIAAFPAPPSNAVLFSNLQAQPAANWTSLGGTAPSGGSNTGSVGVTFGGISPSLSRNAIDVIANGNGYNVQTFNPVGCPSGSCTSGFTTIQADAYIYIPSTSNMNPLQGLEGPDVSLYTGAYLLYPSMQCATNPGSTTPSLPTWNVWSSSAWITLNISCNTFLNTLNKWQHIQVKYNVNLASTPPTFTYNTMYVQNKAVYTNLGLTYAASAYSGGANLKAQFQVDSQATSTSSQFVFDQYSIGVF